MLKCLCTGWQHNFSGSVKISALLIVLVLGNFSSCTFEKRVYRPGYQLVWHHDKRQEIKPASISDTLNQKGKMDASANNSSHPYTTPRVYNNKRKGISIEDNYSANGESALGKTQVLHKFLDEKMQAPEMRWLAKKTFSKKIMQRAETGGSKRNSTLNAGLTLIAVGLLVMLISIVAGKASSDYWSEASNGCLHVLFFLVALLVVLLGIILCIVSLAE